MAPIRVVLVVLALVAAGVGAHALRADHRCTRLQDRAGHAPGSALTGFARDAAGECGDPRSEAWVIGVATLRGNRSAAIGLAREMTREHPDDYLGWLGLYRLTGDRTALARAHALNPRAIRAS
jgi:hypothetical protein